MSDELKADFVRKAKEDNERTRQQHKGKKGPGPAHSIAEARKHGLKTDWQQLCAAGSRRSSACKVLHEYPLAEIAGFIDWTPFFQTWELTGRYPKILQDEVVGEAARNLFRRRAGHAEAHHRGEVADGQRRDRPVPGQQRERRRRRGVHRRVAHAGADHVPFPAPADGQTRGSRQSLPGRSCRAQGIRRQGLSSAASRSPRASASSRARSLRGASTTTTARSCSRRWPTGWPRPLPS